VKTFEELEARRDHLTAEECLIIDRHKLFEDGKVASGSFDAGSRAPMILAF
jgi:hypothetical protein